MSKSEAEMALVFINPGTLPFYLGQGRLGSCHRQFGVGPPATYLGLLDLSHVQRIINLCQNVPFSTCEP